MINVILLINLLLSCHYVIYRYGRNLNFSINDFKQIKAPYFQDWLIYFTRRLQIKSTNQGGQFEITIPFIKVDTKKLQMSSSITMEKIDKCNYIQINNINEIKSQVHQIQFL